MHESFSVYNASAILNRALEFPIILFRTKMRIFMYVLNVISCKNDVTLSFVNVTRLYLIDSVMKIKLATKCRHASPC